MDVQNTTFTPANSVSFENLAGGHKGQMYAVKVALGRAIFSPLHHRTSLEICELCRVQNRALRHKAQGGPTATSDPCARRRHLKHNLNLNNIVCILAEYTRLSKHGTSQPRL